MTQQGSDRAGLDEPGLGGVRRPCSRPRSQSTPRTSHGDGDHERFAHYVRKEKILESALSGDPVIALCGKVWVPGRDPKRSRSAPPARRSTSGIPAGGGDKDKGDS